MPTRAKGRVSRNRSVSFPPELLDRADLRARSIGLTFSGYLQQLVRVDLGRGTLDGGLVVDDPGKALRVAEDPPRGRRR